MKERIVIDKGKKEEIQFKNLEKVIDGETCVKLDLYVARKQIKTEQVPTNWEEFKKMCFELPNKIEYYTYNEEELIGISGMYFWQKGRVTHNIYDDGVYVYAKNRTPQQMWNIIKNLIGEE